MSRELEIIGTQPASIESYAANLEAKLQVANLLLKSGMLPAHYKTAEAVLTAILYGRELGFSPIRALNSITVIQGKPTLEAQAMKALAIAHGGVIKTVEWTDQVCTLECTRGNWTDRATYTLDDAAKAGLVSKDNWRRMPKPMLYARCVTTLVRNMFADVLGGLYGREEMEGELSEKAENYLAEKTAKRSRRSPPPVDSDPEWLGPPAVDPNKALKDAIDGEDWLTVGAHVIRTKCSLKGMAVRDAVSQKLETARANLKRFTDEADRLAVAAYIEFFKVEKPAIDVTPEQGAPNA